MKWLKAANVRPDDWLKSSGRCCHQRLSAIYTFGGDRELFPVPPTFMVPDDNYLRIENDVWRYGPRGK